MFGILSVLVKQWPVTCDLWPAKETCRQSPRKGQLELWPALFHTHGILHNKLSSHDMWSLAQIISSNLCYLSLAWDLYCSSCSSRWLGWKTAKNNHRISFSTAYGGREQNSKEVEQKENFRMQSWVWYICISFTVPPSKIIQFIGDKKIFLSWLIYTSFSLFISCSQQEI